MKFKEALTIFVLTGLVFLIFVLGLWQLIVFGVEWVEGLFR